MKNNSKNYKFYLWCLFTFFFFSNPIYGPEFICHSPPVNQMPSDPSVFPHHLILTYKHILANQYLYLPTQTCPLPVYSCYLNLNLPVYSLTQPLFLLLCYLCLDLQPVSHLPTCPALLDLLACSDCLHFTWFLIIHFSEVPFRKA